jgi:hypothetical protein
MAFLRALFQFEEYHINNIAIYIMFINIFCFKSINIRINNFSVFKAEITLKHAENSFRYNFHLFQYVGCRIFHPAPDDPFRATLLRSDGAVALVSVHI